MTRRVLLAYAVHDPAVGYCQSLNFVAAMLLLVARGEAGAFGQPRSSLSDGWTGGAIGGGGGSLLAARRNLPQRAARLLHPADDGRPTDSPVSPRAVGGRAVTRQSASRSLDRHARLRDAVQGGAARAARPLPADRGPARPSRAKSGRVTRHVLTCGRLTRLRSRSRSWRRSGPSASRDVAEI